MKNPVDHIPTLQRIFLFSIPKKTPTKQKVKKIANFSNVNLTWRETLVEYGDYIFMELGLFNIHSLFEFARLNFVLGMEIILEKIKNTPLQLIDHNEKLILYYVTDYKLFNYLKDNSEYYYLMTNTGKTKHNYWHNILDNTLKDDNFWVQFSNKDDTKRIIDLWNEKDYDGRNCWFYAAKNIKSIIFWEKLCSYHITLKNIIFKDWIQTDNNNNVWMMIASNEKINNSQFWESTVENSNNFKNWTNDMWKLMTKNVKNINFWSLFIANIKYIKEYEQQFKLWNIETFLNAINNKITFENENRSLLYLIFKTFEQQNYDYKYIVVDILHYCTNKIDYTQNTIHYCLRDNYAPPIYKTIFSFNDEITNFAFDIVFKEIPNEYHDTFLEAIRFSSDYCRLISNDNDVIILLRSEKTREKTILNALLNLFFGDGDNGSYGGRGRQYLTENVSNKIAELDLLGFDVFDINIKCYNEYKRCSYYQKLNIMYLALLGNTKQYWDYISTKFNYEQFKAEKEKDQNYNFSVDYNHYRINIFGHMRNINSDDFWKKIFSIVSREIDSDDSKKILKYMNDGLKIVLPLDFRGRENVCNFKSVFLKEKLDEYHNN
jgi:hypothetical protein